VFSMRYTHWWIRYKRYDKPDLDKSDLSQTLLADYPDVWDRESVFVVSTGPIQAGKVLFNKQGQLSIPDIETAIHAHLL
jgi:hypothetical protein